MIITNIEEISKSKVKVSADDGTVLSLYKSELKTYGIAKDKELSDELYSRLVGEVLTKRAKLRCMNLLKSRDYTRHELENKLKDGCYPKGVIDEAVSYVMSYGYIDDMRYATSYIGYKSSAKSTKQIKCELLRKGVEADIIEQAFAQCEEEKRLTQETELISRLLEKKKYDKETATYEEKQKIIGFLYRKGFPLDKIYKVVE